MSSASSKYQDTGKTRGFALSLLIVLAAPGIVLWYLWWGRFRYHSWLMQGIAYAALGLILVLNYRFFGKNWRSQGFRLDNLRASLKLVLPVTLVFAAAILCYGWWRGHWYFEQWSKIGLYLVWAAAQQYALQNLLLARSETLLRYSPAAIAAASAIFALLHLPSWELAACSFVGAVAWCWIFSRVPNLWTLALSHSVLAVLLLVCAGPGFRIGKPGYRYEAYGSGVQVAGGYFEDGKPFVATLAGYDAGVSSQIKLFTPDGTLIRQWPAFPEYDFSGNLAVGDLGLGSGDAIAVTPGPAPGNPQRVRIFDSRGELREDFEAPGEGAFGAYVAIGCGKIYVTPGPAPARDADIFEFDASGKLLRRWHPGDLGLVNSVRALPVDTGGKADRCPEQIALFGTPISVNPSTVFLMNTENGSIRPLASTPPTYGLNAALFRRFSKIPALVTAPGPLRGYSAHVRIYDISGKELFSRIAYDDPRACGSNVSSLDIDGDGNDEIVLGEGICRGAPSTVRIESFAGKLLYRWDAYADSQSRWPDKP